VNSNTWAPKVQPHPRAASIRGWLRQALARQRELTVFALILWLTMLPALVAMGLDERTLRGVSVWAKPLKFMASVGLLAATTAWFIGFLPPEQRQSRSVQLIVRTILIAGSSK